MFATLGAMPPPAVLSAPVNTTSARGVNWIIPEPHPATLTAKSRFPVWVQQYVAFQPQGIIRSVFPDGWRRPEWEFAVKPRVPVTLHPFFGGAGRPADGTWFS